MERVWFIIYLAALALVSQSGDAVGNYVHSEEGANLLRQVLETQQELGSILRLDEPLQPELELLCKTRSFSSTYDLTRSFQDWLNHELERLVEAESLDLKTAKHFITALHSWAFWYEEILPIPELRTAYSPFTVSNNHSRISNDVYPRFWKWSGQLNCAKLAAHKAEQEIIYIQIKHGLLAVAGSVTFMNFETIRLLEDAVKFYEDARLITEDIPIEWEQMLEDYATVEDYFYSIIASCQVDISVDSKPGLLERVMAHYEKNYTVNREALDLLKNYKTLATRYFRELQKLARHELFDLPTTDLSYYWYLKFRKGSINKFNIPYTTKKMKKNMRSCALGFSTVNQFQSHCVFDFEKRTIIEWVGFMKGYYDEAEWKQIQGEAATKASWYDMAHRMTPPVAASD